MKETYRKWLNARIEELKDTDCQFLLNEAGSSECAYGDLCAARQRINGAIVFAVQNGLICFKVGNELFNASREAFYEAVQRLDELTEGKEVII